MPLIPKNYPTYKMLTLEIFVECEQKEIEPLRKALYDFYSLLQGTTDPGNPTLIEYNNYLTIAHLSNLKFIYESKPAAQNLHQRITVALLRYCEFIRLDKLFYEAGISCQKNVHFLLLRISSAWLRFCSTDIWTSATSLMILTTTTFQKTMNSD
jgi:intraflagellar transport protein 172